MPAKNDVVRLAAISDLHYSKSSQGALQPLFAQITAHSDVLLLCGDLTDYGQPEEAKILARDLTASLNIPAVGVLGNHDFESGEQTEIVRIMNDAGVRILDGDSHELLGIGFAGVRGFCGGFGRTALGSWGEPVIKAFVHEAVEESLKLETALARLRMPQRIALLHYAPVRSTVEGESLEVYPFLGSSRLEEPLSRFGVLAAFHGHAHKGSPEGTTSGGIPVFNVALPVLARAYPDRPTFRVFEVHTAVMAEGEGGITAVDERREWTRRATDPETRKQD